jgi:fibronectin type III domain protein
MCEVKVRHHLPSPLYLRSSISFLIPIAFMCLALTPKVKANDTSDDDMRVAAGTPFQPDAATHGTWRELQTTLQFPNASEPAAEIEAVSSAPPTRSSFMATWDNVTDATGYLLDVSTSSSFSGYAEGYHDLDVGNVKGRVVTGLNPGTTYYYRVRPYNATGPGSYSEATEAATEATTGLIIHATFDSSITGSPNAAAIEAMINRAISIYESLFSDPITIQIRFRYSTTLPNGDPFPAGSIARSNYVFYPIPWNTYINALRADAKTGNDNLANASLPGSALSANIKPSSAGGRAIGLNTPPAMFADGTVGVGGPYDGIVTLNSAVPYQFTRPPSSSNFDAQRSTEHEIDEVMGLGSRLLNFGTDLRPQDLFSWSSAGVRNISSSGARFFSINGGVTNLVNFNQNPSYDFGDWLSTACPQVHPYVQNAVACPGQYSDIAQTSPEGINLDVIGYDLVSGIVATGAATYITSSSATLNGTVNPNGLTTAVHFQYGTTTNYGSTTPIHSYSGNTTQSASANITGLSTHTTYHFRIVASNSGGTRYGSDRTFTTLTATGAPAVTTNSATNIASYSATLSGSVYAHGLTTTVYFQYGTTTSYGHTTATQINTGNTYQSISAGTSALSASTTYHFRVVATNSAGTAYGNDKTFTTLSPTGPPIVTTNPATNIGSISATLNGSLDPHGLATSVYFQYGATISYGHTTPTQSQTGNTYRNISSNINGLSTETTYHFRIVATNSAGIRYGGDRVFTTTLGDESVTFQNNTVHDGYDPASPLVPPLTLKWSRDLSGSRVTSISYPLIAHGLVFVTTAGQANKLMALNEHTGTTVWSANIGGTYGFVNAAYDSDGRQITDCRLADRLRMGSSSLISICPVVSIVSSN